ncbi:hypothetical protein [Micrococcus aloeverae]
MSTLASAVVDLRNEEDWDTGRLVASAFYWPADFALQRLSDVATRIEPQLFVTQGTQVVTPDGLDRVYGGIRRRTTKYQGAGYLVGGGENSLRPGDVLISARADIPALMVDVRLLGSTVSAGFSAYRFSSDDDAYWAWAVLSSSSGQSFFRTTMTESLSTQRPRLGDVPLPWPERGVRARLGEVIAAIESQTHRETDEASETWWSTADLRRVAWRMALASPKPERLLDGTPLEELSMEIKAGRPFDRTAALAEPASGLLPVVIGGVLAGRPITRWLAETAVSSIAEPGDVLVAAVGDRANARIAEQRSIIDSGVYRIRLREHVPAAPVVAFLNGQTGYGLRKLALTGSVIPRVSLKDLKQLRVPETVLDGSKVDGPLKPLAEQLELVLWNS